MKKTNNLTKYKTDYFIAFNPIQYTLKKFHFYLKKIIVNFYKTHTRNFQFFTLIIFSK
jgi:hypothetical protein